MDQSNVKISVVVPCYKSERYLPRCLESLLAQTLDGVEIVVVNDGSPDGCLGIMRRYEAENPGRVRVVDQKNGGLWAARWAGTDVARGAYVAYVDSDDYVDPDFCEAFWECAQATGADVVVSGFRRTVEETGEASPAEMAQAAEPFLPREDPGRTIEVNPAAWNKAFSAELLARMRRLSETPPILEDVALSQLAFLAAEKPVAFAGRATYNYMVHEGSMINTVTVAQVEAVKQMLLEIRRDYVADGASKAQLEAQDATAFLHLGVSMAFRLSSNPEVSLAREIRATTAYLDEHFDSWRHSPYISLAYARAHGGAYTKLLIASWFYKLHLMRPFLACYRFAIEKLHIDVKW